MKTKPSYRKLKEQINLLQNENNALKKERNLREQQLAENNTELEMFFRQSMTGFFFMMLDEPVEWSEHTDKEKTLDYIFEHQKITKINKAMLEQYGAREEDFIGMAPKDFFEHDIAHGRKVWSDFFDDGHLKVDTQEQKFDGSEMIIEGDYICLYDDQGRITGHFGVQREVTEERRSAQKLKESLAKFQSYIDNAPDSIFIANEKGEYIDINNAACEMTGFSKNELLKMTVFEITHEDSLLEAKQHFQKVIQDGKSSGELAFITKNNEKRYWRVDAIKLSETRFLGFKKDITKRKQSEEKLRKASDLQSIILKMTLDYINMPQELMHNAINSSLKDLGEFVEADRAYVFDYDWVNNVCNNTYEWCNEGISPEIDNLQNVPNEKISYWVKAHKNGNEICIEDVAKLSPDDGVRQILEPQGVKSVLAIPMMKQNKCIGFVGFDSVKKIKKYSEKEKTLLNIFSEMLVNIGNRKELENNLVQAKEKAEKNEYRFLQVSEVAGELIWEVDSNGLYTYVSPVIESLLGYSSDEVVGKKYFYDFFIPEKREEFKQAAFNLISKQERFKNFENTLVHKNGNLLYVSTSARPIFDGDDNFMGYRGVDADITERKQAENQLRLQSTMLNAVGQAVIATDTEGTITYFNQAAEELYGWPKTEVTGQNILNVTVPQTSNSQAREIMKALTAHQSWSGEFMVQNRAGRMFPAFVHNSPIIDDTGKLIGVIGISEDITERKQAEEALIKAKEKALESEDQIRFILKYDPNAIAVFDNNMNFLIVSDRFLEDYGVNEKDIIGKNHYEVFPEIPEKWRNIHQRALQGEILKNDDDYFIRPDGSITYTRWECRPWYYANGQIGGMIAYTEVITERKQAEEALKKSEEQYRNLFENMNAGFVIYEVVQNDHGTPEDLLIINANKEFEKTAGLNLKDVIGQRLKDALPGIEKDEADWIGRYSKVALSGESAQFELKSDLLGRYYSVSAYQNEPNQCAVTFTDITERKEAEQKLEEVSLRLSLATKAANVGVWEYHITDDTLIWNDQMFELYGVDQDSFFGAYEAWRSGLHPDDLERADKEIEMALKGEKEFDTEFRVIWPDGTTKHIRAIATVIRDDDGKAIRMIGTNWDKTQDIESLIEAKEKAENASQAKSEFLSSMSHEIRTPLNGVIGFTDLLKKTPLSPVQQSYVDNANQSGHTLLGIISDILDFSKIEAGMLELEMLKTDMYELAERCVDMVKYAAAEKHIEVLLNIDVNMPRFAITDRIRLKQVITNLLSNAVKFTMKGEVELKITYESRTDGHGNFTFTVRDTGIGISEKQKKKLFKAFSQADSSTTRNFGGTGLGLVISEMITNMLGGNILFDSKEGEGSTFWFEIDTETEDDEKPFMASIVHIKRCLIIDDNANSKLLLEKMLATFDIQSDTTDNGLTALEILEHSKKRFDVIICDHHMPDIDGLETIRLIREKLQLSPEKLPVIMLHSSSDDVQTLSRSKELGIRFNLTKPVKIGEFANTLRQIDESPFNHDSSSPSDQPETGNSTQDAKQVSILIAEDVLMNITVLKKMLGNLLPNVHFIEATTGVEALSKYKNSPTDLIFMDVQMPEMDGLEATREIRKLEQISGERVPIIALTAEAFKQDKEKCLSAGMNDFIAKPITQDKIATKLSKYLKLREY